MYTETWTTPLANGVTPDKLIKILHHHATLLDVLAPQKIRFECRDSTNRSSEQSFQQHSQKDQQLRNKSTSTYGSSATEKASVTTTTCSPPQINGSSDGDDCNTTTYTVFEPSSFGTQNFTISITGRADGCEALMSLPNGSRIRSLWQVDETETLVESVEVKAGCWAKRNAKKRVADHYPTLHAKLMQLAATSKSITGSYPLLSYPAHEIEGGVVV